MHRHLTHRYVLNLHILKRDFLLQPRTFPKPPCFVLIFTCYSCRTSINIKVWPIKCCPAWNFTVKRYGLPVSHIDTDRLIYTTAPAVSWSRTTGGYCIRSRDREHGKERSEEKEWWKEGWETRSMEHVRACRNADDGQECWKAASNKNLSRNDSSVSMCPWGMMDRSCCCWGIFPSSGAITSWGWWVWAYTLWRCVRTNTVLWLTLLQMYFVQKD